MFLHVTNVRYTEGYKLKLNFDDGTVKEVDLKAELYGEIFEPLLNIEFFKQVALNTETCTIEWPNGANVAPEFLVEIGKNIERVS